jgi:phage recombination protein Bet
MSQELTTDVQQKKSLLVSLAAKYGMDAEAFKNTIKATVMPSNATNEQMAAFLLVASQYDLNPITKEIYAFPARGGGVAPVVGIDGWINLAQRRHEFDGMEFDYTDDESGSPISCTCRVYRKDRTRPIIVTEYMSECRRATDPWKSHPRRMLRHKAAIQGIRYAFGFSGIRDEDDAEIIYAGEAQRVEDHASVASANIMGQARQKKAAEQQSEWPKKINGVWTDSRGIAFNFDIHGVRGSIPTVTDHGEFKRRRGCNPALHEQLEREALEAIAEADPEPEMPESEPSGPRYEPQEGAGLNSEIRSAIERATNTEDLADAEDTLRDFEGPSDQREELVRLVAVRRHKLMQIERG